MVLLEDPRQPRVNEPLSPRRRAFKWAIRIVIVLAVMFVISLQIIRALGGNSESLHRGAEEYLQNATGMQARIGRLDYIGFYPDMRVEMADVTLTPRGQGEPALTIGTARFSMKFWDRFFSRHYIESLLIEKLFVRGGLLAAHDIYADRIAIIPADDSRPDPYLLAEGIYGDAPFSARLDLEAVSRQGSVFYQNKNDGQFTVSSAVVNAQGRMLLRQGGGLQFIFDALGMPEALYTGTLDIVRLWGRYDYDLVLKAGQSHAIVAVKANPDQITGHLRFPALAVEDFPLGVQILSAYEALVPVAVRPHDRPARPAEIDVQVESLLYMGRKQGRVDAVLRRDGGGITLAPIAGEVVGSPLSGDMAIRRTGQNEVESAGWRMDTTLTLRQFSAAAWPQDIAALRNIKGLLDATLVLQGEGARLATLWRPLQGHLSVVTYGVPPDGTTNGGQGITPVPVPVRIDDIFPAFQEKDNKE